MHTEIVGTRCSGELVCAQFGPEARMVVSEPIGELVGAWVTVPLASGLRLQHGAVEVVPFRPALAGVR